MDIKSIHDKEVNEIISIAKSLDKDTKDELINYLEKTSELMEKELHDEDVDWSQLEYLKSEKAKEFFETKLNDYTIGWKLDEQEIVDFDKQLIKVLKEE